MLGHRYMVERSLMVWTLYKYFFYQCEWQLYKCLVWIGMKTKCKLTSQLWTKTSVLQGNTKNTSITHHIKMVWWIRPSIENVPANKSGLRISIMLKSESICHIQLWEYHMLQLSLLHFHFVGHIWNLMDWEVWEKSLYYIKPQIGSCKIWNRKYTLFMWDMYQHVIQALCPWCGPQKTTPPSTCCCVHILAFVRHLQ